MRKATTFVCFAVLLSAANGADARPWRPDQIPNGNVNGCANCHIDPGGGGPRNAFGQAVEARVTVGGSEQFWDASLAKLDSDGDGVSNGEELQDPDGTWRPGQPAPGNSSLVTLPGDPKSFPQTANHPPVFAAVGAQSVKEGQKLTFQVQATDQDGDTVTITAGALPSGAAFSNSTFAWTPGFDQAGNYTISFTASDGKAQDSLSVAIAVVDVPRPLAIVSFSPDKALLVKSPGDTVRMSIAAESPDRGTVSYAWQVNGLARSETGTSLLVTVSTGNADDVVSVTASDGVDALKKTWTLSKVLIGDINGDNTVNFSDFLLFVASFGKATGDPDFNAAADFDGSGHVDFTDFLQFVRFFGLSR